MAYHAGNTRQILMALATQTRSDRNRAATPADQWATGLDLLRLARVKPAQQIFRQRTKRRQMARSDPFD
jgi:1,2-phenylacetyl-CoA epoxidase catalytic subunit